MLVNSSDSHPSFPTVLDETPTFSGTVHSEALPTDFSGEQDMLKSTAPMSVTEIPIPPGSAEVWWSVSETVSGSCSEKAFQINSQADND